MTSFPLRLTAELKALASAQAARETLAQAGRRHRPRADDRLDAT
jgi:hypothetical protein